MVVPVPAPILMVVPAPAKLTVVAVALTRLKDALGVVKDVVIAGLVPNTNAPEPVSSEIIPDNSEEDVDANTFNLSVRLALRAKLPVTAEKTLAVVKYRLPADSVTSAVVKLLTVFSIVAVILAVARI